MKMKIQNGLVFAIYALILGAFVGVVTFIFLKLMNYGIDFFWVYLPGQVNFVYLPIVICAIGGVFVGLTKKMYGNQPPTLSVALMEAQKNKRVEYKNLPSVVLCAFIPLIFGGSIGPEAALVAILGSLCTWIGDHVKASAKSVQALSEIGMAATLGALFGSPFFGVAKTVEEEEEANILFAKEVEEKKFKAETKAEEKSGYVESDDDFRKKAEFEDDFEKILDKDEDFVIPKQSKMYIYILAAIAGFGTYFLLTSWFPTGGFYRYDYAGIGINEILALLPLAVVGVLGAWLYFTFGYLIKKAIKPVLKYKILLAVVGGIALGAIGILLPYTMFSGEKQIGEMAMNWTMLTTAVLLLTVIGKLFITRFCIMTGWRGGQIFPVIFSGIVLGYVIASVFPIDPIFCAAIVSVSLTTVILRKPAAVVILFIIIFPIGYIIPLAAASIISNFIPVPKFLAKSEKEDFEAEYKETMRLTEKALERPELAEKQQAA
ncbi:putative ion-transport protein YfeO [Methanosarcinaceae archaeon Ag5]|uniref:Ion-transport protein YfeO n=1 Tax=Methanolapillus africanus TaxID=3028297 RepID=A0AAE4MKF1_9EURY|nr:putative ion-transport protein YfeO [Methanosarcinaceae archaeon Ag5]